MRRANQLPLALSPRRTWGGRRAGAGRKPKGDTAGMPHVPRPIFAAAHPAHVTLRMRPGVPSLRAPKLVRALERSFAHACDRGDFRLTHYSLQGNHVHLIVEAAHRPALARGMKAVGARLARAVNRVFQRRGPVLADRYHMRVLKTPREVFTGLRYVLLNARKHARQLAGAVGVDAASSGRWFDGWKRGTAGARDAAAAVPDRPVARARSWLLTTGWRRYGLLDPADVPGAG
jgi:REP-associated tyrosine transposase